MDRPRRRSRSHEGARTLAENHLSHLRGQSRCFRLDQHCARLLLGAHNIVKLPAIATTPPRDEKFSTLSRPARASAKLVETHRALDAKLLRQADAVIAFGSDETMVSLRTQTRWDQKFIAHGHAVSLLWLSNPNRLTTRQARAGATDVLTYDQLGCLSPQAIYVPPKTDFDSLDESSPLPSNRIGKRCPKSPRVRWVSPRESRRRAMWPMRSVTTFGCRRENISAGP